MKVHWKLNHVVTAVLTASNAVAPVASARLAGGPTFNDFLRFSCSELNVQRIDPYVLSCSSLIFLCDTKGLVLMTA